MQKSIDAYQYLHSSPPPPIVFTDSDGEEDIQVRRKPRRHAIRDSDSEEEMAGAETLLMSASRGEEIETDEQHELEKSRRRISAPVDDEDSEPERKVDEHRQNTKNGAKTTKDPKKRERSQRHRDKKEKHSKTVEKLKTKERFSDLDEVSDF